MKIAIINRQDAVERRAGVEKHMVASPYEWFFTNEEENPASGLRVHPDARRLKGRELPIGDVRCFRSHWLLWRSLSESNDDWLCVLEDDVFLDLSFDLEALAKTLEKVGTHYIRLHFLFLAPHKKLGRFGRRTILRFKRQPLGTQAYLISRKAAGQLARSITEIRSSVDEEIEKFWIHGFPILALFPCPAMELGMPTTIFTQPLQRDPKTLSDIVFRQSVRLTEHARRLYSNFKLRDFDRYCRSKLPQQVERFGGCH